MLLCCLVTQLCRALLHPMDCSPSGSSVRRISQARILDCHFLLQEIFPTQRILGCHFLLQEIFPTQGWNLISCIVTLSGSSLPQAIKEAPKCHINNCYCNCKQLSYKFCVNSCRHEANSFFFFFCKFLQFYFYFLLKHS